MPAGESDTPTKGAPEEDVLAQASAFETLEKDFRKVLNELVGDKSLDRFRREYQKLHSALKRSHENQLKLTDKCRELNNEIIGNAQKVGSAMRLSSEDQNSIALLKKEIDKAWKMVDTAHEKEKRAKRTIQQLRAEISNLSKIVDQGAGLSKGQEGTMNELLRLKEDLGKEVETQGAKIQRMDRQIDELHDRLHEANQAAEKKEEAVATFRGRLKQAKSDAERHARRADKTQDALLAARQIQDDMKLAAEKKSAEIAELMKNLSARDEKIKDIKLEHQKFDQQFSDVSAKKEQALNDLESLKSDLQAANDAHEETRCQMQTQFEEMRALKESLLNSGKAKDKVSAEKNQALKQKKEVENQREQLKTSVTQLKSEFTAMKRSTHQDHKIMKELQFTLKRTASSLQIAKKRNDMQNQTISNLNDKIKELAADIQNQNKRVNDLTKGTHKLEKQKEKMLTLAGEREYQRNELQKELQQSNVEKEDINNRVLEEQERLKRQQALYESVRAERNLFSQQHMEAKDEIAEMKRKFKIMQHQIDQFKEEMQTKDKALIKQHFAKKKNEEQNKSLEKQKGKKDEMLAQADSLLASQDVEIKTLRHTLQDAEQASRTQKQVFDSVVDERDILGAQLIRRNDELALLYDKMRILETTLEKGELQYKERVEDIKAINLQLKDSSRQLSIRNDQVANMEALKNEVYHLQRELLQERTKVKALSEELENPINVHRWRKLGGSDPDSFEMIQKIQTLQKRLIEKTEEAVEKNLLLEEKEKLYIELKNILARQPGPEVAEQLSAYQQTLKERTRQMKATAAELNLFQSRVNEYKYEMERLTRELADVKQKYYEQKKRENLVREHQRAPAHDSSRLDGSSTSGQTPSQKFVGGGFQIG